MCSQLFQNVNIPLEICANVSGGLWEAAGALRGKFGEGVRWRFPGGSLAVPCRFPGGSLAVRWRSPAGSLAVPKANADMILNIPKGQSSTV